MLEEPQADALVPTEGLAVKPKGGVFVLPKSRESLGAGYGDADSSAKSRLT